MYDLLIKNGTTIDFERNIKIIADVGIKDGKIIDVGNCTESSKKTIYGEGLIVSPGFIDIHMHEEIIGNTTDGDDYDIANKMLKMGVTTAVGGNCGNNRQDTDVFFDFIDKNGAPINYLLYIGHNYLRRKVGLDSYDKASRIQVEKMKDMAKKDIEENGSIGISFGIEYSPAITFEEMVSISSCVDYDILLSAHYRYDADKAIESIKEMIDISKESNKPMQISHIGSCAAFGNMSDALKLIEEAIDSGLSIAADCYPYDAFSTRIGSAVFDEGCFERWNKSYNSIMLTEEPYKAMYCDKELFYKARKDYPQMLAVAFVMNEEEVIEAYKAPFVYVASDGLLNRGQGHPRAAGTFPRVLGRFVRDYRKLDFIDMLKKMTLLPAKRLGLSNKGDIREGMDADIVIFDLDTIIDKATFTNPTESPEGIEYVIIDGKIALERNTIVNSRLGKSIRRSQLEVDYER